MAKNRGKQGNIVKGDGKLIIPIVPTSAPYTSARLKASFMRQLPPKDQEIGTEPATPVGIWLFFTKNESKPFAPARLSDYFRGSRIE